MTHEEHLDLPKYNQMLKNQVLFVSIVPIIYIAQLMKKIKPQLYTS